MTATFSLIPADFAPSPRVLACSGAITVTAFAYPSGVAALRVFTKRGEAVFLPFHGQQVWDATFDGRRLTMGSLFPEPRASRDYLENYGAFFLHCGGWSMGNPAPEDRHPLHGELPNAAYDRAEITLGDGAFTLSGETRQTRAFHYDFSFAPRLTLRESATEIETEIALTNHSAREMGLQYLAHINFRPVAGGEMLDTVTDPATVTERVAPPPGQMPSGQPMRPLTRIDRATPQVADPELIFLMQPPADAQGRTLAAQAHPDGSADVVRWSARDLPFVTRWITRRGDEDALGVALPATAWPNGRAAAAREGQLVPLAPGATWRTGFSFGLTTAAEARASIAKITGAK